MAAADRIPPAPRSRLVVTLAALGVLSCAVLGTPLAGCSSVPAFACATNASCEGGHCIGGACASPDSTCPSGYRWDDSAGARTGACAAYPDMLMVDPACGNGKLDPGEQCDDSTSTKCPTRATCNDHEPCTNDLIVGAGCHRECLHSYDRLGEGVSCPSDGGVPDMAPGVCHNHACCTGCVGGSGFCESGSASAACGAAGSACADCSMGIGECLAPACTTGGCTKNPVPAGTQCPNAGGLCVGGSCCTGCITVANGVSTCQMGNTAAACGTGGAACVNCMPGNCANGMCQNCVPQCANRVCGPNGCGGRCGNCPVGTTCNAQFVCECQKTADAEATDLLCGNGLDDDCNGKTDCADDGCALRHCAGKSGLFCVNHACTSGCVVNNTFYPAGPVQGDPCHRCEPKSDNVLVNNDGGACIGNAVNGICHGGACCTGCFDGSSCRTGTALTACGTGGKSCTSCGSSCPGGGTCLLNGCNGADCVSGNACANGACQANTTAVACCSKGNTSCQSIGGGMKDCQ